MLGYGRLRGRAGLRARAAAGPRRRGRRQGPDAAAGADHRTRRRQAHAAGAEGLCRGRAGAGPVRRAPGRRASTPATPARAREAGLLLDLLTPVAKSWPSEWCLEANSLAIQVLRRLRLHARLPGRAVLARQPPEHDPRRHARHPGAGPAGPQGADARGRGLQAAGLAPAADDAAPRPTHDTLRRAVAPVADGAADAGVRPRGPPGPTPRPKQALANATPYLQAFGHERAGLAVAGRGAAVRGAAGQRPRRCRDAGRAARPAGRDALLLCLRVAEDRRLAAAGGRARKPVCREMREAWF